MKTTTEVAMNKVRDRPITRNRASSVSCQARRRRGEGEETRRKREEETERLASGCDGHERAGDRRVVVLPRVLVTFGADDPADRSGAAAATCSSAAGGADVSDGARALADDAANRSIRDSVAVADQHGPDHIELKLNINVNFKISLPGTCRDSERGDWMKDERLQYLAWTRSLGAAGRCSGVNGRGAR